MKLGNYVIFLLSKYIFKLKVVNSLHVSSSPSYINNLLKVLSCHYNLGFNVFVDMVGLDFPDKKNRFYVIYNFISYSYATRCFVKNIVGDDLYTYSISNQFISAN